MVCILHEEPCCVKSPNIFTWFTTYSIIVKEKQTRNHSGIVGRGNFMTTQPVLHQPKIPGFKASITENEHDFLYSLKPCKIRFYCMNVYIFRKLMKLPT